MAIVTTDHSIDVVEGGTNVFHVGIFLLENGMICPWFSIYRKPAHAEECLCCRLFAVYHKRPLGSLPSSLEG